MSDFIYQIVKKKLFSFTCPQCHKDYFSQYKNGLARCLECRIKRSFEIKAEKEAKKDFRRLNPLPKRDISLLVKYVFKNRDFIDFNALVSYIYRPYDKKSNFDISELKNDEFYSYYFDYLEYMDIDDFIPLLKGKNKHYAYVFLAMFIPNTTYAMINDWCSCKSASFWFKNGYKDFRHPRSTRGIFNAYKMKKKDFRR